MLKNIFRKVYNKHQRKRLSNMNFSVIASNCNGAFICHDLGVRFNSPFVNLWIPPKDYVKLLSNFRYYLSLELKEIFEDNITYPIGLLGDVKIYFQHYKSFDEAYNKWNERKKRINFDNLFIIFTNRDGCTYQDLLDFDKLPYDNKVVFVNKQYDDIKSSFYIKGFEFDNEVGHLFQYTRLLSIKKYYDQFDYIKYFNRIKQNS